MKELFLKWAESVRDDGGEHRTELGYLTKEGKLVISDNHACHAGLFHSQYWQFVSDDLGTKKVGSYKFSDDPIVAIYSAIINDETPRGYQLMFADYLIKRSPWASCFLNPDAEDVVDSCWVLDPNQPSNYVSGACMATRWLTEWPSRCKAWVAMVQSGVQEDEAFLLSHGMEAHGDWGEWFPIIIDPGSAWHCPLEKDFSKEYFHNFLAHNGRKDEAYVTRLGYGQVNNTWGKTYKGLSYNLFLGIKPRGEEKEVKEKINLNIFFKLKPVKNAKSIHKYTSKVQLKNLVEDIKEIINAAA
jgi:hypothetical protein